MKPINILVVFQMVYFPVVNTISWLLVTGLVKKPDQIVQPIPTLPQLYEKNPTKTFGRPPDTFYCSVTNARW
jgi:hypothetical protein